MKPSSLAPLLALTLLAGCVSTPSPQPPIPTSTTGPTLSLAGYAWRDLAPAPTPRAEHCGANVAAKFYVLGGFVLPNAQSQSGAAGGVPTGPPVNLVEIYDSTANAWTVGPPYPVPLEHCLAAAVGDTLYVVYNVIGAGTPACFKLRVGSSQWTKIADPPHSHYAGVMDEIDGLLYATAGDEKTVDVYDPAKDAWTAKTGMIPTGRGHTSGAAAGGRLYVVAGDVGGHSSNTDANEEYDPLNDTWSVKAPIPVKRGSVHAVGWMGRVVVMGGQDGRSAVDAYNNVDVYNPQTDTWSALPNMTHGRHGFAANVWQDRIYVFGGAPQQGVSAFANAAVLEPRP